MGSVFFGDYPTLMNPVLPIKTPNNPKLALTGNKGDQRGAGGNYIPAIDPTQIDIHYVAPGQMGIPVSTGSDPQDIYETDFAPGQRNLFRQAPQKRLDISFRKSFRPTERMSLQYAFNIFNLTNTTSLDVPQNQTQIRQSSACSNTAIEEGNNCSPSEYFVNYGQIVTGIGGTNQQSALTNLDQLPYHNGTRQGHHDPDGPSSRGWVVRDGDGHRRLPEQRSELRFGYGCDRQQPHHHHGTESAVLITIPKTTKGQP